MTEDGYITLLTLLLAAFSLLPPVRRVVITNFAPVRELALALIFSGACLLLRRADVGELIRLQPWLAVWLQMLAWVVPVLWLASVGTRLWRGRILGFTKLQIEGVLREALNSGDFEVAAGYLRENRSLLPKATAADLVLLFDPDVVSAFHSRRNYLHLELLSEAKFLKNHPRPLEAAEVTFRKQATDFPSPLRSVVVAWKGGYQGLVPPPLHKDLISRTLCSPDWCLAANAHYPLILAAVQTLRRGELDRRYSSVQPNYGTHQGASDRSHCTIYVCEKALTLIVEGAIERGVDGDFYLTDFWQLYEEILNRFAGYLRNGPDLDVGQWELIPFAFLLDEIVGDLREFVRAALREQLNARPDSPLAIDGPGRARVAREAARVWLLCCWAESRLPAGPLAKRGLRRIDEYLQVAQGLRFSPHTFLHGVMNCTLTRDWGEFMLTLAREVLLEKGPRAEHYVENAILEMDAAPWVVCGQTKEELLIALGLSVRERQ